MPLNVVVLIGGNGSNLQAIIDAIANDALDVSIQAVISHRKGAYGLERSKLADIPTFTIEHQAYPEREAFDNEMAKHIDIFKPDLIILAGFMRILTSGFIKRYIGKILNIHPSLLPKYKGLNTHQRAIDAKDAYHGASVHIVTEDLDDGPVLAQAKVAIEENDTAELLKGKVQKLEHILYPLVLQQIVQHHNQIPLNDMPSIDNFIQINHAYLEGLAL